MGRRNNEVAKVGSWKRVLDKPQEFVQPSDFESKIKLFLVLICKVSLSTEGHMTNKLVAPN